MSVLIKGMEKPEHCGYCRFRYDGICHALQKTQYNMNECPLVVIDDAGLNDTISRQAAIDAFDGVKVDEGYCTEYEIGYNDGIDFAVSTLSVLPSAQSEPLRINLNEPIKVKLTDLGKDIYYHQCDELNKAYGREIIKPSFPREDKDGYTRFQLWEFIQLYGAYIGMGAPNVIEPLEIVCERRTK